MRFSLYKDFGALNSQAVWPAVSQGLAKLGHQVYYHKDDCDVAVIWSKLWRGRMSANRGVYDLYRNSSRPIMVIEVGALKRNQTWRIMPNGRNHMWLVGNNSNRAQQLGMVMRPWRHHGDHVLIALQRPDSQQWHGRPALDQWLQDTVTQLRRYTDRPVVVRPHPRYQQVSLPQGTVLRPAIKIHDSYDSFDFEQALEGAWAVVNSNSHPGIHSVLQGVPAFVDPDSLAAPVGNLDLAGIESPRRPDREQWVNDLAWTEFTLEEIAEASVLEPILAHLHT